MWGGGGIVEWGRDAGVSKDAETRVGFAGQEVGVAKSRHSGGFGIGSCMCWSRTNKGRLPSHYSLKELAKKINSSPSIFEREASAYFCQREARAFRNKDDRVLQVPPLLLCHLLFAFLRVGIHVICTSWTTATENNRAQSCSL
jgi:hypothetical protein